MNGGEDLENEVIAGYEVLDELGQGPLGKVYRARHVQTGQMAVLRGFTRPSNADPQRWQAAVARFRALLEAHKSVEAHPNIQDIIDFGEEGSLFYIVSEYFEGRTLREIIDTEGPQSLQWALNVFTPIANAVDYAVSKDLSHSDLQPYNVLITRHDATVRIINYGLAHARNKLGSPYLAPEQLTGYDGDLRSDIYAMGALLYEVLSGKPPFEADSIEQMCRKVQFELPPPLLHQPPFVRDVILKMMAKDPERRYQRVADALTDLREQRSPAPDVKAVSASASVMPWEASQFQPDLELQNYSLLDQDILQIYRMERARQRAEKRRARVRGAIRWSVVGAAILMLFTYLTMRPMPPDMAVVAKLTGKPEVRSTGEATRPLKAGERVDTKQPRVLTTDGNSTVLLEMRGARVKVAPNSVLEIKRLAYSNGLIRQFTLRRGRIWAKVSPVKGAGARFEIASENVYARVRGTEFGVRAFPGGVVVSARAGAVEVDTGKDKKLVEAGKQLKAYAGRALKEPVALSAEERKALEEQTDLGAEGGLAERVRDFVGGLEEVTVIPLLERAANLARLKPAEQAAVIGDAKALLKAQTALDAICKTLMTADPDGVPPKLTLDTLEELPLKAEDRKMYLECFEGNRLLSYQPHGADSYEILARVNDSNRTLLKARDGKITVVKE